MAKFVNLTPHTITITGLMYRVKGPMAPPDRPLPDMVIPPSGSVARCSEVSEKAGWAYGVPLSTVKYGPVTGLPEPEDDVIYIVSAQVRQAVPDRKDVASPGALVRNDQGQPIGCRGLVVN